MVGHLIVVAILERPGVGFTLSRYSKRPQATGCGVYTEILNSEDLAELRLAFDMACSELGLGTNADDEGRREH